MTEYAVKWEIVLDAGSAREAAEKAHAIQLDKDSIATVYEVQRTSTPPGFSGPVVEIIDLLPRDGAVVSEPDMECAICKKPGLRH